MDKRSGFKSSFLFPVILLAAALAGCGGKQAPSRITFIALSDTHIAADSDLNRFRQFLHTVRERGDFVLITGDICGHAPEYLEPVREIARGSGLPVYMLPGNHDDNYARHPQWWSDVFGTMHYAFDAGGYVFLMNWSQDSLAAKTWLAAMLDSIPDHRPLVYCQHFPPTGSGGFVLPLLEARPGGIALSIAGHTHTESFDTLGATIFLTLENCYMGERRNGRFYEVTLEDGRLSGLRSFAFDSLELKAPPDRATVVSLDDTAACVVLDRATTLTGTAGDDNAVALVEYSLGGGPWQSAKGLEIFAISLDPSRLAPGHHGLLVRARDSAGNLSDGFARTVIYVPETRPGPGTVVLYNGSGDYRGCRDITVRRHDPEAVLDGEDLECWTFGPDGAREFSEFYIAFDLTGARPRHGAKLKAAELTLFCSRQNSVSPESGDDLYRVGLPGSAWDESMSFSSRPAFPGWTPVDRGSFDAPLTGEWVEIDGRQELNPAAPVSLDLSAFIPEIERRLDRPAENHGWVISPVRSNYNVSFRSSEYAIKTMRPRLTLVFE